MTGNELRITNHEVNGFLNSFQHTKNTKNLKTYWPNAFLPTTRFCRHKNHKSNYHASCNTQTSKHWLTKFFFQNLYCWFISQHNSAGLAKPNKLFQRYWRFVISEHYGHGRHARQRQRKTLWSNCSFHGYLIACQKQTFYFK